AFLLDESESSRFSGAANDCLVRYEFPVFEVHSLSPAFSCVRISIRATMTVTFPVASTEISNDHPALALVTHCRRVGFSLWRRRPGTNRFLRRPVAARRHQSAWDHPTATGWQRPAFGVLAGWQAICLLARRALRQ